MAWTTIFPCMTTRVLVRRNCVATKQSVEFDADAGTVAGDGDSGFQYAENDIGQSFENSSEVNFGASATVLQHSVRGGVLDKDFNGDGLADILWQNANGTPAVWLMNGTGIASTGPALPNPRAAWQEKDTADFDGDGKADILW